MDTVVLVTYASEGDNIPDAMHMASAAVQYLDMIPPAQQTAFQWQIPGSWCNLYGPPVNDMMY
jgi:proteasome assembly chaperone 2